MKEIRFIHISDVLLGSRTDKNYAWSEERSKEIYNTFEKIIGEANSKKADFLFISGNLFAGQPAVSDLDYVNAQFARLATASVLYVTGPCDYLKPDSALSNYRFCPWVYVLGRGGATELSGDDPRYAERSPQATVALDHIRFIHKNVNVYGMSFFGKRASAPGTLEISSEDYSEINIMLLCQDKNGHIPVHISEIKRSRIGYAGIGGQEKYEIKLMGKAYCPGSPEAVKSDSTGPHGYVFGKIAEGKINIQFVPAACRMYKVIDYPVTNYTGLVDAQSDIVHLLELEGRENMYKINLVRKDNCEKNFEIAEALKEYRIIDINGEHFDRTDYEDYIKANKNSEFGELLHKLEESDIGERESVKFVVDQMIEMSGLYMKGNRKMSRELYQKTKKEVQVLLETGIESYEDNEEIKAYKEARKTYDVSPDVLEELNRVWAEERGTELQIKTIKSSMEEIPRQRKRAVIKARTRLAANLILVISVLSLILLPVLMKFKRYDLENGIGGGVFIILVIIILVIYTVFYLKNKGANDYISEKNEEKRLDDYRDKILKLENKRANLHEIRTMLQLQNGRKRELRESITKKEKVLEEILYKLDIMKDAQKIINELK